MRSVIVVNERGDPRDPRISSRLTRARERCTRPSRSMCSEIKEGKSSFSDAAPKNALAAHLANTCCSHPFPEETSKEAGERRLREEMGFSCPLSGRKHVCVPGGRSGARRRTRACDALTANVDAVKPVPNPAEVAEWKRDRCQGIAKNMQAQPESYAPWFHLGLQKLRSMKHLHLAIIPDGNRRWAKTAACCPGTAMKKLLRTFARSRISAENMRVSQFSLSGVFPRKTGSGTKRKYWP